MKKALAFMALIGVSCAMYAQNEFEVASAEYTGNYSNHQFLSDVSDIDSVRSVFQQNAGGNIVIDKFFQIPDDDEDAEDVRMVNWVLNNELPAGPDDGDCFTVEVIRGVEDNYVDGWDIFVRYSRSNGWTYVLYYFLIHAQ
jgi:hypothetical protein